MSIHVFYKARLRDDGAKTMLHRIEADTSCHAEAISAVREVLGEEKRFLVTSPVLALIGGGK